MNKSTHFSGQPIFSQLLKLLDRGKISSIAKEQKSDRYFWTDQWISVNLTNKGEVIVE